MHRTTSGIAITTVVLASATAPALDIINSKTYVRAHLGWRTPVIMTSEGKVEPAKHRVSRKTYAPRPMIGSPAPSPDWRKPEFDDFFWARSQGPVQVVRYLRGGLDPAQWDRICTRARFHVADPSAVKGLKAVVRYVGGAVVYVNGVELTRAHLSQGTPGDDAVAEAYDASYYVGSDGVEFNLGNKEHKDAIARRVRSLEKAIPASMLRKGVNVIAVEVRRAPVNEVYLKAKKTTAGYRGTYGVWAHGRLAGLTVSADAGATPNCGRPPGLQVWAPHPMETVSLWDWGDACETPAVRMIGARNGTFSGRIMVSSTETLSGLTVSVSELVSKEGGKISSSAVAVRWAQPYETLHSWMGDIRRFEILDDTLPAEVKPRPMPRPRRSGTPPSATPAAVVPVWLTVRVPADARPGRYEGSAVVGLAGKPPVSVPVRIDVGRWTIPDPRDWQSHNNLYHSHDTTAMIYGVDLWSDKHFALMEKSLVLGKAIGNRFCITPLVCENYTIGNSESMVRWIDKGNGKYDYDFSVFERYLDLYGKTSGKPDVLLLDAWGRHSDKSGFSVTVVDPKTLKATGRIEKRPGKDEKGKPVLTIYRENVGFWKPMFAELLARLKKRGWLDVAVIGTGSDTVPSKETVDAFKAIWPEYNWFAATHMSPGSFAGKSGSVPVRVLEHVWGAGKLYRPGTSRKYPGCRRGGRIVVAFPRTGQGFISSLRDYQPLTHFRCGPEGSLQGGIKGIGRVGLDYLPISGRDIRSGRQSLKNAALCGGSHLGCDASTKSFVSAGKDGPVANERYEMFREGMQVREAIIFIRNNADKVGGDLAKRVHEHLDWRAHHYGRTKIGWKEQSSLWDVFCGSGYEKREAELYELAAQVAEKVGGG